MDREASKYLASELVSELDVEKNDEVDLLEWIRTPSLSSPEIILLLPTLAQVYPCLRPTYEYYKLIITNKITKMQGKD